MADCPHGSSMPDGLVAGLQESQGGSGRHRCAVCAFARGFTYTSHHTDRETCAHGSVAPTQVLSELPEYQGNPARHRCTVCAFFQGLSHSAADPDEEILPVSEPDETDMSGEIEGNVVYRTHRVRERSRRNRALAILHHGSVCLGCGFDFDAAYTREHARGYIEVHHISSLSEGPQIVDPTQDLIPLCANCHRMVHRDAQHWLSLEELRERLDSAEGTA